MTEGSNVTALPPKEFLLLFKLCASPGRIFTRRDIMDDIWGIRTGTDERTVDVHIRRLRAKLGGEYEHLIGTVRNVGYRFDPPDEESEESTAKSTSLHSGE